MLLLAHSLSAVSPALAGISFSVAELFLVPLFLFLSVATTVFWIMMLVDCARRMQAGEKDKIVWLIVVALAHVLGAAIYYFAGRGSTGSGGPTGQSPPTGGMNTPVKVILIVLGVWAGLILVLIAFKLVLAFSLLLIALLAFPLWIWALVDCARRLGKATDQDRTMLIVWLLVVIFTNILGTVAYFVVKYLDGKYTPSSPAAPGTPPPYTPPPPVSGATPPPVSPQPTSRPAGQCPKCGAPLGPDAPEGLCPRCLLQMNLGAPTQFPGVSAANFTTAAPPPPPSIEEIAAHFPQLEILECLGRGGMGVVYKARQPRLNRIVALKILAPGRQQDPQFAERFLREAQALAKLNHPNIVTVFDFGESEGLYYLLMEFVDGVTLRGLLHGGKIESAQALAIVPRICEALQYAHEQGIVHRDIKPENVLIDKQGRVKIADFGIARMLGVEGLPAHTRDRYVIGTPYYMAPEQVEHPLDVDHRADIYSLGVVFYEMLTGELPLGRFALPSQKVTVDVRLDDVVLRALEKEPQRRYQQAGQVKSDVETISGGGTGNLAAAVAAPPPSRTPPRNTGGTLGSLPEGEPRFSGKAIAGLFWAALGLAALLVMANVRDPFNADFIPLWIIGLPCLAAPFGTTILGWMAVGDILRSQGRICGMWLAMVDGLLAPLAVVDGLITFLCYLVLMALWGGNSEPPSRMLAVFGLAAVTFSLLADIVIVWFTLGAVRRARQVTMATVPPALPPPSRAGGIFKALAVLFLIGVVTVALLAVVGVVLYSGARARQSPNWSESVAVPAEVVSPEVPSAPSPAPAFVFGPTIERNLQAGVILDLKNAFIAFESGRIFSISDLPSTKMTFEEDDAWLAQQGVEASCVGLPTGYPILSGQLFTKQPHVRFVALTNDEAASLEAADVPAHWQDGQAQDFADYGGAEKLPASFLFKTKTGNFGVVEISAITDQPFGLKIQYKLVQPLTASKADGASAVTAALQNQLIQAQQSLERIKQQFAAGLVSNADVLAATAEVEVLTAQLTGDPLQIAQKRLEWGEKELAHDVALHDNGLLNQADLDDMQAEVARLKTELTVVQNSNRSAGSWPAPSADLAAAAGPMDVPTASLASPVAIVSSAPGATAALVAPPPSTSQAAREQASREQDAAVAAEVAAIKKLDFENNRLTAFINIAHRTKLSPTAQTILVEAAFDSFSFENNKLALLREIIKRPDFSATARAAILARLSSLDFEPNRMTILNLLNQKR